MAQALLKRKAKTSNSSQTIIDLRLYVAGATPKSLAAISNLKKICDEHLKDRYHIEVVDLVKNPSMARDHQILAIPTLVRSLPIPIRKIIGDLSDTERVVISLDIRESKKGQTRQSPVHARTTG